MHHQLQVIENYWHFGNVVMKYGTLSPGLSLCKLLTSRSIHGAAFSLNVYV